MITMKSLMPYLVLALALLVTSLIASRAHGEAFQAVILALR
jgi:hypothetical protein